MNCLHGYKTVLTIEAYSWLMVHKEKQYLMTNKAYVILKRVY